MLPHAELDADGRDEEATGDADQVGEADGKVGDAPRVVRRREEVAVVRLDREHGREDGKHHADLHHERAQLAREASARGARALVDQKNGTGTSGSKVQRR